MDSSLFFMHSPSSNIIGVTGSKGKTTAANAIAAILRIYNPATVAVGIDGVSPLGEFSDVVEISPVVFELSSWRLEALEEHKISPHTAVVTSLYHEHLNTYRDFDEYVATKKIIIRHQGPSDIAILNYDDVAVREWEPEIRGRLFWFSMNSLPSGDGIYIHNGMVTIRVEGEAQELFSLSKIPLTHAHEQRNVLPALLLGHILGMNKDSLRLTVKNIKPLPHRLETVRRVMGAVYVNDSAATMPDATIAALHAYAGKPVILIIGGSDKKLEFNELADVIINAKIRTLIWLPGTATQRMQKALEKAVILRGAKKRGFRQESAQTMQEAVAIARRLASPGDTVLLSPGATSFGLFKHEFDRGDQFRKAVLALK